VDGPALRAVTAVERSGFATSGRRLECIDPVDSNRGIRHAGERGLHAFLPFSGKCDDEIGRADAMHKLSESFDRS
jgi:hypothetical protein